MRRLLLVAALVGSLVGLAQASASPQPRPTGSWTGTYSLGGKDAISVSFTGSRAVVALGVGHAEAQAVPFSVRGVRLRFQLPGRPDPVVFSGTVRGQAIEGTVHQGKLQGSFRLHRGAAAGLVARGSYATSNGRLAVVDDPYGPARLLDTDSGEVHGLFPSGSGFVVGAGWSTRTPQAGTARFDAAGGVIRDARATRVPAGQLEVRFSSAGAMLAGTLTIPAGAGTHAAVAFVHGSGPTGRAYLPDFSALLVRHGIAVLAYDKRGIGQSGGSYPGESPTATTIDVLARDAAAAARFLAATPGIDPARVGLAGHSQAGWIMPLAASRERAVRFVLAFAGPAVTADEVDLFQDLAGEGERPPSLTDDEINARVQQAGPGGVDPLPWIRSLRVPVLWLYGGLDRHIPTELSLRRLQPLLAQSGRDFRAEVFPHANHALVETRTGLTSEMLASHTFAPGLFASVSEWLRAHGLAGG
jgi:dienelactone hydrolase